MLLSVSTLQKVRKNRVVAGNRPLAGENRRLVAVFFVSFPNNNASPRRREQLLYSFIWIVYALLKESSWVWLV